ncbi:iron-sulfur cluster biosynthesis family protein [Paenibacillus polygoni]|uniref:Iron-sulfur cluster biosynthesis family protein n=1 Tax=Paenibacillus polygoni TaxID=3050112 RepID=A0ABY8WYU9_9BACL|nr:iron-sulfur cluster biosynthesis family protein [Paenibacillus polygoni]WIV17868.1 iron-sulfur cluster biosynthesis family protein [Paenibacillus polygoni]
MRIKVSKAAEDLLKKKLGDTPGVFRLIYDTEGCGCAVNGVPAFHIVSNPEDLDITIESNVPELNFIIDGHRAVFFEEELILSTDPGDRSLRLSSNGQHYGMYLFPKDTRLQNQD